MGSSSSVTLRPDPRSASPELTISDRLESASTLPSASMPRRSASQFSTNFEKQPSHNLNSARRAKMPVPPFWRIPKGYWTGKAISDWAARYFGAANTDPFPNVDQLCQLVSRTSETVVLPVYGGISSPSLGIGLPRLLTSRATISMLQGLQPGHRS
jgi:hypothetical protein